MTVAWYDGATLEVSVAFSANATSNPADGSYTDISAYVRDVIGIQRGRSSERDTFQAGSLTLTLDNRDRRFDPDYSAGPYFGVLLPMRHIRVRLTYSASTSWLFHGFVQGWPQEWEPSNSDDTVAIVAHDAFKLFAKKRLPESAWSYLVGSGTAGNVQAWYRLGEVDGDAIALDSSGSTGRDATYTTISTSTGGLPELSTDAAREVTTAITTGKTNTTPVLTGAYAPATGTAMAISMWVTIPLAADIGNSTEWLWLQSTAGYYFAGAGAGEAVPTPNATPYLMIGIDTLLQRLKFEMHDGTNLQTGYISISTKFDGDRHHIVFDRNTSVVQIFLDGVNTGITLGGGSVSAGSVGYGTSAMVGLFREGTWVIDEVGVYNSSLNTGSPTYAENLFTAGSTAHSGETVSARISRVITMTGVGVPTSLDTSTVTVRGCDFSSGFLLGYLQNMELTEGGQARLFIAADGTLTFHSRYHDSAAPTVITAFSDAAGTTLPYSELTFDGIDDLRIYNDVTVSRTNGVAQRSFDATSVTAYGTIPLEVDGISNQSDPDNLARAQALVYQYKTPLPRIRALNVTPRSAPTTLFPKVRTTELGTRISARRLPVGVGSAWTKEQTVEGVAHSISVRGEWVSSYLTAPADVAGVWLILDDATYGLLDTGRLGF